MNVRVVPPELPHRVARPAVAAPIRKPAPRHPTARKLRVDGTASHESGPLFHPILISRSPPAASNRRRRARPATFTSRAVVPSRRPAPPPSRSRSYPLSTRAARLPRRPTAPLAQHCETPRHSPLLPRRRTPLHSRPIAPRGTTVPRHLLGGCDFAVSRRARQAVDRGKPRWTIAAPRALVRELRSSPS